MQQKEGAYIGALFILIQLQNSIPSPKSKIRKEKLQSSATEMWMFSLYNVSI
jgi:hypothetical protein